MTRPNRSAKALNLCWLLKVNIWLLRQIKEARSNDAVKLTYLSNIGQPCRLRVSWANTWGLQSCTSSLETWHRMEAGYTVGVLLQALNEPTLIQYDKNIIVRSLFMFIYLSFIDETMV